MADQLVRDPSEKRKRGRQPQARFDEIARRYEAGEAAADLAIEFGVSKNAVRNACHKRKAYHTRRITPKSWVNPLTGNVRQDAFSRLTPESAYWIGMLMNDGNVTDGGRISLRLQTADAEHVRQFRAFLDATNQIQIAAPNERHTGQHTLAVTCKQMASDLARFGVTPRKSYTAAATGVAFNRDFWRGVIDGDGTVYVHRKGNGSEYPGLALCGSQALVTQFHAFCLTVASFRRHIAKHTHGAHFVLQLVGHPALAMITHLYSNASVALARKQTIATYLIDTFTK